MRKRILALVLVLTLCCTSLTACTKEEAAEAVLTPSPTAEPTPEPTVEVTEAPAADTILRVACSAVEENINPFYADSDLAWRVLELTQASLLTTARDGSIVWNAATGETVSYGGTDYAYSGLADISVTDGEDGTSVCRIALRKDAVFSDGEPLTADDVIFTYYVLLDPAYDGSEDLTDMGIVGMQEYQTGTPTALYTKYAQSFTDGYAALFAETEAASAGTEETEAVSQALHTAWLEALENLKRYCLETYLETYADFTGYSATEIAANEGLQVMFTMWVWGFGEISEDGTFLGKSTGTAWDLTSAAPTMEDFYTECNTKYGGDPVAYWAVEGLGNLDILTSAKHAYITSMAQADPDYAPVTSISGISRIDDYTVEITTRGYNAGNLSTLLGVWIAPLHQYGDAAAYDYESGAFGFEKGDLSTVKAASLLGAGAYRWVESDDVTMTLEANPNYYGGTVKTKTLRFIATGTRTTEEILEEDLADIMAADAVPATGSVAAETMLSGSFSYIGISARNVSVGTDTCSESSVALRKALACVLAAGRQQVLAESGSTDLVQLEVPVSADSWTYPVSPDGAYSTDITGAALYTEDSSDEDKMAAATDAARTYLLAAGYTWGDAEGCFTGAPEGASLSYTAWCVKSDTLSAALLAKAAQALSTLGLTLECKSAAYTATLREKLREGSVQLWASELSCDSAEDLYRYFHSDNVSTQNVFSLASAAVDELILQLGQVSDPLTAQALYCQCFDTLEEAAVIVPCYESSTYLVCGEHISVSTFPADLTRYYPWTMLASDIEMIPE